LILPTKRFQQVIANGMGSPIIYPDTGGYSQPRGFTANTDAPVSISQNHSYLLSFTISAFIDAVNCQTGLL